MLEKHYSLVWYILIWIIYLQCIIDIIVCLSQWCCRHMLGKTHLDKRVICFHIDPAKRKKVLNGQQHINFLEKKFWVLPYASQTLHNRAVRVVWKPTNANPGFKYNFSMFGHQTMFDRVWLQNMSTNDKHSLHYQDPALWFNEISELVR